MPSYNEMRMKSQIRAVLAVTVAVLFSATGFASLRDIRTDHLPNDPSIMQSYSDVLAVEDMVSAWSNQWNYSTPKEQVVLVMTTALDRLVKAGAASPDNEELQLLTGLVAHYAYNVDVSRAYDIAVNSLDRAHQLAPEDFRPQWFLGNHLCQSTENNKGMEAFLAVEGLMPWGKLPYGFWDDYAFCATITAMPAHVLLAADHAEKLGAPMSKMREFLVTNAHNKIQPSSATENYSVKDSWSAANVGSSVVFTSWLCGIRFSTPGNWKPQLFDVKNASCIVPIETAPSQGKTGDVYPYVILVVHQSRPGETLDAFVERTVHNRSLSPAAVPACPLDHCSAFEAVSPGLYKKEGDGHLLVTAFKRDQPEYPGLIFEEPSGPPTSDNKTSGVRYYHPLERRQRFSGTLFYVVVLDSADSVFSKAKQDYDSFLKSVKVE
jgi:hypothetical protein